MNNKVLLYINGTFLIGKNYLQLAREYINHIDKYKQIRTTGKNMRELINTSNNIDIADLPLARCILTDNICEIIFAKDVDLINLKKQLGKKYKVYSYCEEE